MDLKTAKGFERHNQSYDWQRNCRRAEALHDLGYSWDYDSTYYKVFCQCDVVYTMDYIQDGGILDNFLSCLRVAEAHLWRTQ